MTWIVVALYHNKTEKSILRFYFGPFGSEEKANQYAEHVNKQEGYSAFSTRLEKPVIE